MSDATNIARQPATWRIVLAAILDFFTIFWVAGFLVSSIFGGRTEGGFALDGWPALLCFALIVAYFVVFNKIARRNDLEADIEGKADRSIRPLLTDIFLCRRFERGDQDVGLREDSCHLVVFPHDRQIMQPLFGKHDDRIGE